MHLLRWCRNGSLRVYRLKMTPGKTISRLPSWVWPFALLYWNIRTLCLYAFDRITNDPGIGFFEPEVAECLTYGVKYVYCADVDGDIAEFGTMSGTTAATMARAMERCHRRHAGEGLNKTKKLMLFDSFQGLPKAETAVDQESPHVLSGLWREGACRILEKEDLSAVCAKFLGKDGVSVHEGWFKDSLPRLAPGTRFAMMHIDCDLYESTRDVLDYCFGHGLPQEGAAIFFDDWHENRAAPRFGERRAWAEAVEKYSIVYSEGREYGVSGKKFIVHAYKGLKV